MPSPGAAEPPGGPPASVAAVAIGRNEGDRLRRCLASLAPQVGMTVYVDSGSTDGSQAAARALGAEVVALDPSVPFTAARARNAGFARLAELARPEFVQFIDGDCELDPGWIATARAALEADPALAIVFGRRRERHPEASVYNRLADAEWDMPVGPSRYCGGDVLMRRAAFEAAGGYDPALIAGEEPELCVRLRALGWKIERLDAEMTLHDAALTRFGQWWRRSRRAGHAYAEGATMHGRGPERHFVAHHRRALFWGAALPLGLLLGAGLVSPWLALGALAYPLQGLRLARRMPPWRALFVVLGKFPEAQGALGYHLRRLTGSRQRLIEYK